MSCVSSDHFFADQGHFADIFYVHRQRLIKQVPVLHDGIERGTQGGLVSQQQADRTEI
jgi:hypothetical protein